MQLHTHLKSMLKKAALAAVALGGLLCFGGAASAQAREVIVVRRPVIVARPVVVAPRVYYGPYFRHEVFVHGWRDRFGCWHRY
jgi:ABC-type sugar transport system substrate-binding protein